MLNTERFFVSAMQEIRTPRGTTILPGDHVLIDPEKQPKDGDLVMVEGVLLQWASQKTIEGVAVQVSRDIR